MFEGRERGGVRGELVVRLLLLLLERGKRCVVLRLILLVVLREMRVLMLVMLLLLRLLLGVTLML